MADSFILGQVREHVDTTWSRWLEGAELTHVEIVELKSIVHQLLQHITFGHIKDDAAVETLVEIAIDSACLVSSAGKYPNVGLDGILNWLGVFCSGGTRDAMIALAATHR